MKKGSNYHLAVTVVFLLLLQSVQDVPECKVDMYDLFTSSETIARCIEIEDIFEAALLEEKANSYVLRKTFLSSLHPSPQLLNVMYYIMDISSQTVSITKAVWSSSQVFTIIDPTILHDFQSGIMTLVYYMEGILFPNTIFIYLNLSSHHSLTENEIIHGIISITEKLKAYAIHQDKLKNWNGQDKGYVIISTTQRTFSVTVLIPIATVLFLIVGTAFSWRMVQKLSILEESYETDVKTNLFWSFVCVISLTNMVDIILLTFFSLFVVTESRIFYVVIKIVSAIIIAIVGAALGFCSSEERFPRSHRLTSGPFCCCPLSVLRKMDQALSICSIFVLVYLIGISIISTTALMAVYPILVLSTVTYIVTSIFSMVSLLAIPNSFGLLMYRWSTSQNDTELRKHRLRLCDSCLYIIGIIALNLLNLIYLLILSKTDNTNNLLRDLASLLPSFIPGVVGYIAKKKLTANKRKNFKEQLSIDSEYMPSSPKRKEKIEMSPLVLEGEQMPTSSDNENETTKLLTNTEETEL